MSYTRKHKPSCKYKEHLLSQLLTTNLLYSKGTQFWSPPCSKVLLHKCANAFCMLYLVVVASSDAQICVAEEVTFSTIEGDKSKNLPVPSIGVTYLSVRILLIRARLCPGIKRLAKWVTYVRVVNSIGSSPAFKSCVYTMYLIVVVVVSSPFTVWARVRETIVYIGHYGQ